MVVVAELWGIRLTVLLIEVVVVRQVDLEHLDKGTLADLAELSRYWSPSSKCHSGGGGGGAGAPGNSTYPNYNGPSISTRSSYPVPTTWSDGDATGGNGGAGKPNTAFASENLAGYVPEPAFPLKDLVQEIGSTGLYGGGGGGGCTMQPSEYYAMRVVMVVAVVEDMVVEYM